MAAKTWRARGRLHVRYDTWCAHCGEWAKPCECSYCHPDAVVGRQRQSSVIARYYGIDVPREYMWMHERCVLIRQRWVERNLEPPAYVPAPAATRPACLIDLTTRVLPAPVATCGVVTPADLRERPFRAMSDMR